MRNMSFSITTAQVKGRRKDVTRRMGWWSLKPGDVVQAVEKAMGLKKGEKVKPLAKIRIVKAGGENLSTLTKWPEKYGRDECKREGFPGLTPRQFVAMFCASHKGCTPTSLVNRIEFEYVE